jgi:hypothetical protein
MKIWQTTDGEVSEGKYLVIRRDGTIPIWPNFVIGGYDPCAAPAMRAYGDAAKANGYDPDFVASCYELADKFEALAATETARKIADPDAPPHRHDDINVIKAMRRKPAFIHVRPDRHASTGGQGDVK